MSCTAVAPVPITAIRLPARSTSSFHAAVCTTVPAKGPIVLANDVAELIGNEPELLAQLRPGTFTVSNTSRHSYESAGPRFKKYAGTDGH